MLRGAPRPVLRMRLNSKKIAIVPSRALPRLKLIRHRNSYRRRTKQGSMAIDATPPVAQDPTDWASPPLTREPVLAAAIAFLALAVAVVALGFFGYSSLDLGSTDPAAPVRSIAPAQGDGISFNAVAFVDALDLEAEEAGAGFVVTATAHIGSEPALLPEGEIRVLAHLLGPNGREYELESFVDDRGNVAFEQDVREPGIYTISISEIVGDGLSYDPGRDEDLLASVRVGDDEGPNVEERTVEDAESESEETVETETTSSEVDRGVVDAPSEAVVEEPEPEATPGAFEDANDDLFGDGEEPPVETPPDPDGSPFVPPGSSRTE